MDLSIIIPAYNEAARLPKTLQSILDYFRSDQRSVEIIVVDDGSNDTTAEITRSFPGIRLIQHPKNLGKGAAVRTGMLAASGEWRYLCDADLSSPINELDHLLTFADRADVMIGSRRVPGAQVEIYQPTWKVWLGQIGNALIQLLIVPGIRDSQCGFKLFHRRTMQIFQWQRNNRFGYDFEDLYLARRLGWRMIEVPVVWRNDQRTTVRLIDYPITLLELFKIHLNRLRGLYPKS